MNSAFSPGMRRLLRFVLVFGLVLSASAATYRPAALLRDINTVPQPLDSNPAIVCTGSNFTLLYSYQPNAAFRLWATDGTTARTIQVGTIASEGGLASFTCVHENMSGQAFFTVSVDNEPQEFWRTDGTVAGTYRLLRSAAQAYDLSLVGVLDSLLIFGATPESGNTEVYRTDGSISGTRLLRELTPGPDGSSFEPPGLVLRGRLLFKANGDLWSTDGTPVGTVLVVDQQPANEFWDSGGIVPLNAGAVFVQANIANETQLWFTDGTTAGSQVLVSFPASPELVHLSVLTQAGPARVVFAIPDSAAPYAWRLWSTDGTAIGTQPLLASRPDFSLLGDQFYALREGALFAGRDTSGLALWVTDGTDAGTRVVHDAAPGEEEFFYSNFQAAGGGYLYITMLGDPEIWFTDGTPGGTWSVTTLNTQFAAEYSGDVPIVHGDNFYLVSIATVSQGNDRASLWRGSISTRSFSRVQEFAARDVSSFGLLHTGQVIFTRDVPPYGREPWVWDAVAGSRLLRDMEPARANGWSQPAFAFSMQGQAFLAADDGVQGVGLWRTDGSTAGTIRISAGAPVAYQGRMPSAALGNQTIYAGTNSDGFAELWRTDATTGGTELLLDLSGKPHPLLQPTGSNPASCGAGFVQNGSALFYGASPLGVGKLFRTNGTAAGTIELGSFPRTRSTGGFSIGLLSSVCVLGQAFLDVYFEALDPVSQMPVLWRHNIQTGANEQVRTQSGVAVNAPLEVKTVNGALFFFSNTEGQMGLWRILSGDSVAHMQVARTWPHDSSYPALNTVLGSLLLFRDCELVDTNTACRQYRTDGTIGGTYALTTAEPTRTPRVRNMVRLGNRMVYAGRRDQTGFDLWFTDGTPAGSTSIRIAVPGEQYMSVRDFVDFNGLVYFSFEVFTGTGDVTELWRTDGTVAGTERVNALPSVISYTGPPFVPVGQRLLFAGISSVEGEELWFIENDAPVALPDSGATTAPAAVTIDVLANDSDPDGTLPRTSVRITRVAANGSAVANATGSITYTPTAGFAGNDTFEYLVADAQGRESAATTVTVAVGAAPPVGGGGSGGGSGGSSGGGGSLSPLALLALILLWTMLHDRPGQQSGAHRCANSPRVAGRRLGREVHDAMQY
jgi:ELWxxDGT repeat protein